jgi:hypothetical protein
MDADGWVVCAAGAAAGTFAMAVGWGVAAGALQAASHTTGKINNKWENPFIL